MLEQAEGGGVEIVEIHRRVEAVKRDLLRREDGLACEVDVAVDMRCLQEIRRWSACCVRGAGGDGVEGLREGALGCGVEVGVGFLQVQIDAGAVVDGGVGEDAAVVERPAGDDGDVLVESALPEEGAGGSGNVVVVEGWIKDVLESSTFGSYVFVFYYGGEEFGIGEFAEASERFLAVFVCATGETGDTGRAVDCAVAGPPDWNMARWKGTVPWEGVSKGSRSARRAPTFSTVRCHMQPTPSCTITLTEHGDVLWIAAEDCDVLLDPFQSQSLIEDSRIERLLSAESWTIGKSKYCILSACMTATEFIYTPLNL